MSILSTKLGRTLADQFQFIDRVDQKQEGKQKISSYVESKVQETFQRPEKRAKIEMPPTSLELPIETLNDSVSYVIMVDASFELKPLPQNKRTFVTPPTPVKSNKKITSPYVLAALKINAGRTFQRDGVSYQLIAAQGLRGDVSQLYHVQSDTQLVQGIPNDRIYVKVFHKEVLNKEGNHAETGLLKSLLAQYDRLQGHLPTIIIHNRNTAHTDGYLIVEKVQPLVLPWTKETSLEKLSEKDSQLLAQIKPFFDFAFKDPSMTPLDLKADNLGVRENGTVVLLDFMEYAESDDFAFQLIAHSRLNSFAVGNEEIFKHLSEGCELSIQF